MKYIFSLTLILSSFNAICNEGLLIRIGAESGFTQNSVRDIIEDDQGFKWLATPNGIYRYDGYKFVIFNRSFDDPEGLQSSQILCLFKDSKGNIWAGTKFGLARYNHSTNSFKRISDIIKYSVISIGEDINGTILISTGTRQYALIPKSSSQTDYKPIKLNINKYVSSIYKDLQNNIWMVAEREIILIKNDQFRNYKNIKPQIYTFENSNFHIRFLKEDKYHQLLAGTDQGIFILGNLNNTINITPKPRRISTDMQFFINDFVFDKADNLWVATNYNGIIKYEYKQTSYIQTPIKNNLNKQYFKHSTVKSLFLDKFNILWLGFIRDGLAKFSLKSRGFKLYTKNPQDPSSLPDAMINTFFEDSKNRIWVGTFSSGAFFMKSDGFDSEFISLRKIKGGQNFPASCIMSITEDKFNNLWFGSNQHGVFRVKLIDADAESGIVWEQFDDMVGAMNNVTKMIQDSLGNIWAGSFNGQGLLKISINGKNSNPEFQHFTPKIGDPNALPEGHITDMIYDDRGILWLGTQNNGVIRVIFNDKHEIIKYSTIRSSPVLENSLKSNQIYSLRKDHMGDIWIGTWDGGLSRISSEDIFAAQPTIKTYLTLDGLSTNIIYGILEDENNRLWLSTDNGITAFDPYSHKTRNYSTDDGLQDPNFRKFAFLKTKNGRMYFGGPKGFNAFNPKEIKDDTIPPDIVLTEIRILNHIIPIGSLHKGRIILDKPVHKTKEIVLGYEDKSFTIGFAGIHYTAPRKNRYKYRLKGFDSDWRYTESNERFATYSNLKPRIYTFEVLAANGDNIWSKKPAVLKIIVNPPWWFTKWAFVIYGIIIFLLIWAIFQFLKITQKFHDKLEIERIKREQGEELTQTKIKFFTDISHEFKTPLTLISGIVDDQLPGKPIDNNDFSVLKRNIKRLYNTINELIEFRKVNLGYLEVHKENYDIIPMIKDIIGAFDNEHKKRNITLQLFLADMIVFSFDAKKIEKVLFNIISNAFKFTPNMGSISISAKVSSKKLEYKNQRFQHWCTFAPLKRYVRICIEDSGIGIKEQELHHIFKRFYSPNENMPTAHISSGIGLSLVQSYVEAHKGALLLESEIGKGSRFSLFLPYELIENNNIKQFSTSFSGTEMNDEISHDPKVELNGSTHEKKEKPIILVIDDNLDIRSFLKKHLNKKYHILLADNGVSGLEMATNKIPDLVISDVVMPKMDGFELCKLLKRQNETCHIPVILLTAKDEIENRIEGLEMGADSYIPKPFILKHLLIRIEKLLELRNTLRVKYDQANSKQISIPSELPKRDVEFIERLRQFIDENIDNSELTPEDMEEALNLSRMQLYRKLTAITGMSANKFLRDHRLKRSAELLIEGSLNVTEVFYAVGFTNNSYFTRCFKKKYNIPPKDFRDHHLKD